MRHEATVDRRDAHPPLPWSFQAAGAAVLVASVLALAASTLLRLGLRLDPGPITGILVQDACVLAAIALVASCARPDRAQLLRFGRTRPGTSTLLLLGLAVALTANLLWALLGPSSAAADDLTELTSGGWFAGVWMVLALVLVAPLAEEFLFRRVAFSALRAQGERLLGWRGGLVAGALLSSALFALAHVAAGRAGSRRRPCSSTGWSSARSTPPPARCGRRLFFMGS